MATISKLLFFLPAQQRMKLRPMRPKPLIATLITASCPLSNNQSLVMNHIISQRVDKSNARYKFAIGEIYLNFA